MENKKEEKPITVDMGGVNKTPLLTDSEVTEELQKQFYEQNKTKQEMTSVPTYTPKNYYEQFAVHDGHLYVNINNTWIKLANFIDI